MMIFVVRIVKEPLKQSQFLSFFSRLLLERNHLCVLSGFLPQISRSKIRVGRLNHGQRLLEAPQVTLLLLDLLLQHGGGVLQLRLLLGELDQVVGVGPDRLSVLVLRLSKTGKDRVVLHLFTTNKDGVKVKT